MHEFLVISNPKFSQERWFLFFVYYTDLSTGRPIKKQLIAFFGEQFKKSHENLKKIIFQSHVSDLDKNKKSKFYYCYIGLAITASFVEHFHKIMTLSNIMPMLLDIM